MEIFTRFGRPSTDAALRATNFDDALSQGVEGNFPVKAIAAQVNKFASLVTIIFERIQHSLRVVLGMTTCDDGAVGLESI